MRIAVGTTNKGKVQAVQRATEMYDLMRGAEVTGFAAQSGVPDQPMDLDQIITGAKNRARGAFESGEYDLGFGLESGLFPVPHTKSEYMDTCCCAIYDGKEFHLGLSYSFEYPKVVIKEVIEKKVDVGQAVIRTGLSPDPDQRVGDGMLGQLTHGKVTRIDFSLSAIQMAMIHLENAEHYSE